MIAGNQFVTSTEAAELLGVSPATLYAYVSRGRLHSTRGHDGRSRVYARSELEKLLGKRLRLPNELHATDSGFESSLTLVQNGCLYYQGVSATTLAESHPFLSVAWLLWTGEPSGNLPAATAAGPLWTDRHKELWPLIKDLPPLARCQSLLALTEHEDLAPLDRRPVKVQRTGLRILHLLAAALTGKRPNSAATLADLIQGAWLPKEKDAARLINAALVLLADHDLNSHSLAARCAASAGASPYGVVMAGLGTLEGVRQGAVEEQVAALLREATADGDAASVVANRLARGDDLPGFGHDLYPEGDPRCSFLLNRLTHQRPGHPLLTMADRLAKAAEERLGLRPNVDFALAVLSGILGLPPGGMLGLLALGRTAGWIGHALEQYASGSQLRLHTRYVGRKPALPRGQDELAPARNDD